MFPAFPPERKGRLQQKQMIWSDAQVTAVRGFGIFRVCFFAFSDKNISHECRRCSLRHSFFNMSRQGGYAEQFQTASQGVERLALKVFFWIIAVKWWWNQCCNRSTMCNTAPVSLVSGCDLFDVRVTLQKDEEKEWSEWEIQDREPPAAEYVKAKTMSSGQERQPNNSSTRQPAERSQWCRMAARGRQYELGGCFSHHVLPLLKALDCAEDLGIAFH